MVLGYGTCGIAAGATAVKDALEEAVKGGDYDVDLDIAGCMGVCFKEPVIEIFDREGGSVIYGDMTPKKVPQLLEEHVGKGKLVEDWILRKSDRPLRHRRGLPRAPAPHRAAQLRKDQPREHRRIRGDRRLRGRPQGCSPR